MGEETTQKHREIQVGRLMQELERQIIEHNASLISEQTGGIQRQDFILLGQKISQLRADYLHQLLNISRQESSHANAEQLSKLRGYRLAYEELLNGFEALKHALERGYVSLDD